MSEEGVCARIYENDECVYENRIADPSVANLPGLISHLRDAQIKINDFLTSLVEKQHGTDSAQNRLTSESESDSAEEIEVNPKKCRLIN